MTMQKTIVVASAVITNAKHELLLVRKKNTPFFMQVGGKLEDNESAETALYREVKEEIGCDVVSSIWIDTFSTQAANEPDHALLSHTFLVEISGRPQIQAELVEMLWIDPRQYDVPLAPLTEQILIPWWLNYLKNQ